MSLFRVGMASVAAAVMLSACADFPLIGANNGEALPGKAAEGLTTATAVRPGRAMAASKYSINTTMGVLLDTPDTREVLQRHIPSVVASNRIGLARGMSLKSLAGFGESGIDPATLTAIDQDLAKIGP